MLFPMNSSIVSVMYSGLCNIVMIMSDNKMNTKTVNYKILRDIYLIKSKGHIF